MWGFLAELLLGDGTLRPELRALLEEEGLVLIEEGLPGSVRYRRFRAPGRYHHGKLTPERIAIGVSEDRLVVYCRSGRVNLIDTPFSSPRIAILDVSLRGEGKLAFRIDYDRGGVPKVSGEVTIVARTSRAAEVVEQVSARLRHVAPTDAA